MNFQVQEYFFSHSQNIATEKKIVEFLIARLHRFYPITNNLFINICIFMRNCVHKCFHCCFYYELNGILQPNRDELYRVFHKCILRVYFLWVSTYSTLVQTIQNHLDKDENS